MRFWEHFGCMLLLAQAMHEKRRWIVLCTKHQVISYGRKYRRRLECHDGTSLCLTWVAPEQSHDATVLRQELIDRIEICLLKLKPEQYRILRRHYLHGDTAAEIAAHLGITTHALEQRLLRARCKLRKLFLDADISEAEVADYFAANTLPLTTCIIR